MGASVLFLQSSSRVHNPRECPDCRLRRSTRAVIEWMLAPSRSNPRAPLHMHFTYPIRAILATIQRPVHCTVDVGSPTLGVIVQHSISITCKSCISASCHESHQRKKNHLTEESERGVTRVSREVGGGLICHLRPGIQHRATEKQTGK